MLAPNRVTAWHDSEHEQPDDETIVLICCPEESEPVWLGYKEGDWWFTAEGMEVHPTHWMELPEPLAKA